MRQKLKKIYRSAIDGNPASLSFEAEGNTYIRNFTRPERLILLGCGHISQALCRYAADLGFSVTAVDERPDFANSSCLPEADAILCNSFPDAIRSLDITASDYVVVLTRGHRFDADCLRAILPYTFPKYLGMVGSRRRVALLFQQLESEGFSREDMERIHAPVGLHINAMTVNEIAVSIVAELISCRRFEQDRGGKGTLLVLEDIDQKLLEFLACDDSPKSILVVCETNGSTPVKSGAMMAVNRYGKTAGTIGGGCSENDALTAARRLIGTGKQECITIDMSNEYAAEEGMVCGGTMKVWISDV